MPEAHAKAPEDLSKKGNEKKESKLDSPEAATAITKREGHRIIDNYMANAPKPREDWDEKPEEKKPPKKEQPEKKPDEAPRDKPKTREEW